MPPIKVPPPPEPPREERDGAEIVRIDFGEPRLQMLDRYEGTRECSHARSVVNEVLHRVTCKDCDEVLDAVEVLLEYARHERRLYYSLTCHRDEVRRLKDEAKKLTRQRSNLRAAVKYAIERLQAAGGTKEDYERARLCETNVRPDVFQVVGGVPQVVAVAVAIHVLYEEHKHKGR